MPILGRSVDFRIRDVLDQYTRDATIERERQNLIRSLFASNEFIAAVARDGRPHSVSVSMGYRESSREISVGGTCEAVGNLDATARIDEPPISVTTVNFPTLARCLTCDKEVYADSGFTIYPRGTARPEDRRVFCSAWCAGPTIDEFIKEGN